MVIESKKLYDCLFYFPFHFLKFNFCVTIFKKSVKLILSKEEILGLRLKKGIDVSLTPVRYNSSIYIATFSGTDLNPSSPDEEREQSDLDEEIAKLKVYSDRIREPDEVAKIPKKARQVEMRLDDPLLDSNKYAILRRNAHSLRPNGMAVVGEG